MEIKLSKKDYLWGYAAQLFHYGAAIFILPPVLRTLPKEYYGAYSLFFAISSFVALLDLGFSSNFARAVTYAYSGVKSLHKEGIDNELSAGRPNYELLHSLIANARKIYAVIGTLAFVGFSLCGTAYLWHVLPQKMFWEILPAWCVYASASVFNFFYSYFGGLLQGRGSIVESCKMGVISKIIYIALVYAFLFAKPQPAKFLLGISIALAASSLIGRFLGVRYFFNRETKEKLKKVKHLKPENLVPVLWHNSKKIALNSLGVFCLFQLSLLLTGIFLSLGEVAEMGVTIQFFGFLMVFAKFRFNTTFPRFNYLAATNQQIILKKEFLRNMLLCLFLFFFGFAGVLFFGNTVLQFIGSKTQLPGATVILLYGGVYLMEALHGNCAAFITVKNVIPFVWQALLTGAASLTFSLLFLKHTTLGLASFPLGLILAQVPYNAWRWPLWVVRDLRIQWHDFAPRNLFG
jgi:O-antigen/teichoic acid export membrane protein